MCSPSFAIRLARRANVKVRGLRVDAAKKSAAFRWLQPTRPTGCRKPRSTFDVSDHRGSPRHAHTRSPSEPGSSVASFKNGNHIIRSECNSTEVGCSHVDRDPLSIVGFLVV